MEKTQLCSEVLEANEGHTGVDTGGDQRRQIGVGMDMTPSASAFGVPQSKMSAKTIGKIRTPSADSQSAFHQQQLPYAYPSHSVQSFTSLSSTTASPGPGTLVLTGKKVNSTSTYIKNNLYKKLSDFAP